AIENVGVGRDHDGLTDLCECQRGRSRIDIDFFHDVPLAWRTEEFGIHADRRQQARFERFECRPDAGVRCPALRPREGVAEPLEEALHGRIPCWRMSRAALAPVSSTTQQRAVVTEIFSSLLGPAIR